MNELSAIQDYYKFKEALGTELRNQAEGFVRTGYLLKKARDTDILKDSGYSTVAEFAQAEYGLSKDIVSRYIAINDRYSKDGYSEYLQDQYEGYGVAKLQEMLTLPDSVVEMMSPDMTKREIQDIKKEIKEEEQISDVEVLLEGSAPDQEHMTIIQKVIHKYFYEQREQYISLEDVINAKLSIDAAVEKVLDILAPSGMALKTVRVQGIGKLMISFKGKDNDVEMLNVRTNEKEYITWQQFIENMVSTFAGQTGMKGWERIYGEPFELHEEPKEEKNTAVAPVQQKEPNVHKNENPACNEKIEKQETEQIEQQLPGQMNVNDFPEIMPEEDINLDNNTEIQSAENNSSNIENDENIDNDELLPSTEVTQKDNREDIEVGSEAGSYDKPIRQDMIQAARNSLSNINTEMQVKSYKAALSSAKNLVYYLEVALGEK